MVMNPHEEMEHLAECIKQDCVGNSEMAQLMRGYAKGLKAIALRVAEHSSKQDKALQAVHPPALFTDEMLFAANVKNVARQMDESEDPVVLAGLANLGNYLWFRLQQKNAKTIGEPVAERKHEDECKRYKALLPAEWQW